MSNLDSKARQWESQFPRVGLARSVFNANHTALGGQKSHNKFERHFATSRDSSNAVTASREITILSGATLTANPPREGETTIPNEHSLGSKKTARRNVMRYAHALNRFVTSFPKSPAT